MTAPSPTARATPGGTMLENGFASKVTFEADPDVSLWEVEVTEGGFDIGDPIDKTTMHNTGRRTKAAPALDDTEDGSILCAYDPAVIDQVRALKGVHTTITNHQPDGSSVADFGWLRSFKPNSRTINGFPTAVVGFSYAGEDSSGNEEEPVYTAPA